MLCYCSPLLDLVGCFGKPVLVEKETTLISVSISFLCAEGLSQVRESADFVINIRGRPETTNDLPLRLATSLQVGITVKQLLKYLHTTVGSIFDSDVKLLTSLHERICRHMFMRGW